MVAQPVAALPDRGDHTVGMLRRLMRQRLVHVIQRGYRLGDVVLRPARVIVAEG